MNRKKVITISGLIIIILASIFEFSRNKDFYDNLFSNGKDKIISINLEILPVKAIKVQYSNIRPQTILMGTIEYFEKVNITSKISGRIERIYVHQGDKVWKGQILAKLERLPLELEQKKNRAALEEAKASLNLAKEKLQIAKRDVEKRYIDIEVLYAVVKELEAKRQKIKTTYEGKKKLFEIGGVSKEDFSSAKTSLLAIESQHRAAQKKLEIAKVGFRDIDLKEKKLTIPKDIKKKFKLLVYHCCPKELG